MMLLVGGPHDGAVIDDPEPYIQMIAAYHYVFGDLEAGGKAFYRVNRERTEATFERMQHYPFVSE